MRESYCGICDDCQLGAPEFLEALSTVKEYLDHFRVNWWAHCFPGEEGFSIPEFRKGLEWFLDHTECSGCKGEKGDDRCAVRLCALRRGLGQCYECPEMMECDKLSLLTRAFPNQQAGWRQMQYKAREFHAQPL